MDIEAEIRNLKLRVDALERHLRPGSTVSGRRRMRAQRRRMNIPAQTCTPAEDLQTDITTTSMNVTEMTTRLRTLQAELSQDISAVNDEIAGMRRQANDHFSKLRAQIGDQHTSVYRRLTDLTILLERLLKKTDP